MRTVTGSLETRLRRLEEAAVPEPLTVDEMSARVRWIFMTEPDSERARRIREILQRVRDRLDREAGRAS